MGDKYYYTVEAREGAPGCADDVTYRSDAFTSFAKAYDSLVFFVPHRVWPQLRSVQTMYIWKEGATKVRVGNGFYEIEISDLPLLGVTEEEFDSILEDLNKKQETQSSSQRVSPPSARGWRAYASTHW